MDKKHLLGSKLGLIGGCILILFCVISAVYDIPWFSLVGVILSIILFGVVPSIYSKIISKNNH